MYHDRKAGSELYRFVLVRELRRGSVIKLTRLESARCTRCIWAGAQPPLFSLGHGQVRHRRHLAATNLEAPGPAVTVMLALISSIPSRGLGEAQPDGSGYQQMTV